MNDIRVYALSEDEALVIDRYRSEKVRKKEITEKRKTCQHDWRYDGHSHNDDCYICKLCGETEYR